MERIKISGHPSVMFIHSQHDTGEVILSGYDGGYPRIIYASAPNLLGGNPETADKTKGPFNVLLREVTEEIDRGNKDVDWKGRPIQWASLEDITLIRDSILQNTRPFADFFVDADGIMVKPRDRQEKVRMSDVYKAIYSAFRAEVGQDVFECVRENIKTGKKFFIEGYIGINSLGQLAMAGEYSTSHITGHVLNNFFGSKIPMPEQVKATNVGAVRRLYSDYDTDYEHTYAVWGAK